MKIKELKETIKNLPDDMEVIILGYCGHGANIDGFETRSMVYDDCDNEEKNAEKQEVLALRLSRYLIETEDIGYVDAWMNPEEYKETYNESNSYLNNEEEEC